MTAQRRRLPHCTLFSLLSGFDFASIPTNAGRPHSGNRVAVDVLTKIMISTDGIGAFERDGQGWPEVREHINVAALGLECRFVLEVYEHDTLASRRLSLSIEQ